MGAFYGLPVSGMSFEASALHFSIHENGLWTGGAYGMEASLPATIAIILFAAMLFWRFFRSGAYRAYSEPGSKKRMLRFFGYEGEAKEKAEENE